jgi:hypothetical protein
MATFFTVYIRLLIYKGSNHGDGLKYRVEEGIRQPEIKQFDSRDCIVKDNSLISSDIIIFLAEWAKFSVMLTSGHREAQLYNIW